MMERRKFREIEAVAHRAPSAHNTQPWRLRHDRDAIVLLFDPNRHLAAGDASGRDLLLSLGAFAEAFLIAAASRGEGVRFEPDIEFAACQVGRFLPAPRPYPTSFSARHLEARQTSRLRYRPEFIDSGVCVALRAHLEDGWQLHHVESSAIALLLAVADRFFFERAPLVAELRRWLRLGQGNAGSGDGLSAACLDLGPVEAMMLQALLSRPIYPLARRLGLARAVARQSRALLDPPHSVIVLTGPVGHAGHVLSGGRMLLRVWLELAQCGRYAHPLSQILDCPNTRLELATMVGCSPGENILAIFRAGRSPEPARSSRRPIDSETGGRR